MREGDIENYLNGCIGVRDSYAYLKNNTNIFIFIIKESLVHIPEIDYEYLKRSVIPFFINSEFVLVNSLIDFVREYERIKYGN